MITNKFKHFVYVSTKITKPAKTRTNETNNKAIIARYQQTGHSAKCSLKIPFEPLVSEWRFLTFFQTNLVLVIFLLVPAFFRKKTQFIKFSIKYYVEPAKFLRSKCTTYLLHSKAVQRNCLHFFKDFKKQYAL